MNEKPDQEKIKWLAERFYKNNYEIMPLLDDIFTSDWFYSAQHIGSRIKSPIELLAGIRRMIPMKLENEESQLVLQRILGQVLFYPPNVAGWPGGKAWIDSSTLLMRMRIPQLFSDSDELNITPKSDDDQMMGRADAPVMMQKPAVRKASKGAKPIEADLDWSLYQSHFEKTGREKLVNAMAGLLLQTNQAPPESAIQKFSDESTRAAFIRTATIQIMSTPEYQLC